MKTRYFLYKTGGQYIEGKVYNIPENIEDEDLKERIDSHTENEHLFIVDEKLKNPLMEIDFSEF